MKVAENKKMAFRHVIHLKDDFRLRANLANLLQNPKDLDLITEILTSNLHEPMVLLVPHEDNLVHTVSCSGTQPLKPEVTVIPEIQPDTRFGHAMRSYKPVV